MAECKTLNRPWSVLAAAVLAQYAKDKKKDDSTYISKVWKESLLDLATRYAEVNLQEILI